MMLMKLPSISASSSATSCWKLGYSETKECTTLPMLCSYIFFPNNSFQVMIIGKYHRFLALIQYNHSTFEWCQLFLEASKNDYAHLLHKTNEYYRAASSKFCPNLRFVVQLLDGDVITRLDMIGVTNYFADCCPSWLSFQIFTLHNF